MKILKRIAQIIILLVYVILMLIGIFGGFLPYWLLTGRNVLKDILSTMDKIKIMDELKKEKQRCIDVNSSLT